MCDSRIWILLWVCKWNALHYILLHTLNKDLYFFPSHLENTRLTPKVNRVALKQRHTSCSWRSWGTLMQTNNLMTTAAMLTSVIKIMQEPRSSPSILSITQTSSLKSPTKITAQPDHITHTPTQTDAGQRAPGVHFNVSPIRVYRRRGHRWEWNCPWTHTFKIAIHHSLRCLDLFLFYYYHH